jgi:hypothetical protein
LAGRSHRRFSSDTQGEANNIEFVKSIEAYRLKVGQAEIGKGGVILDVITHPQKDCMAGRGR